MTPRAERLLRRQAIIIATPIILPLAWLFVFGRGICRAFRDANQDVRLELDSARRMWRGE